MKLRMLTTSASPDRILEAGKVYNLPRAVAEPLLATYTVPGVGDVRYAEEVKDGARATPVPSRPDPGDVPEDAGEFEDIGE